MSALRTAAQQALEALEYFVEDYQSEDGLNSMKHYAKCNMEAITSIKAALEQPEQEPVLPPELEAHFRHLDAVLEQQPVGEVVCIDDNCENGPEAIVQLHNPVELGQLLYAHPPRREWRGLTPDAVFASDEIMAANASLGLRIDQLMDLVHAVEQALKERNT